MGIDMKKDIQTVALLGAGAVGSYFINGLTRKLGENLWVIAKGERKERLEKEGLIINGTHFPVHVKTPELAKGVDLLLISVKYGALEESLDDIAAMTGENTIVMSLLNGVDSEQLIAERIGEEHLVYSLMKISAERKNNSIFYIPEATLGVFFGDAKKNNADDKVQAVARLLDDTPVRYKICEDIIQDMWYKFALNVSKNLPQAMIGCGYGAYAASEHVMALSDGLLNEVIAVAAAKGIDISDKNAPALQNSAVLKTARFSTLQDLDAARHTEVDMFSGAMIKMGRELGIPVPYNEFTFHMIKALEEKNDGRFDF